MSIFTFAVCCFYIFFRKVAILGSFTINWLFFSSLLGFVHSLCILDANYTHAYIIFKYPFNDKSSFNILQYLRQYDTEKSRNMGDLRVVEKMQSMSNWKKICDYYVVIKAIISNSFVCFGLFLVAYISDMFRKCIVFSINV